MERRGGTGSVDVQRGGFFYEILLRSSGDGPSYVPGVYEQTQR